MSDAVPPAPDGGDPRNALLCRAMLVLGVRAKEGDAEADALSREIDDYFAARPPAGATPEVFAKQQTVSDSANSRPAGRGAPQSAAAKCAERHRGAAQEVIGQCDCIITSEGYSPLRRKVLDGLILAARHGFVQNGTSGAIALLDAYDAALVGAPPETPRDLSRCPACGDVWENAAPRWHACSAADRLVAVAAPEMTDAELVLRVRGIMAADPFGRAVVLPEIVYSRRASAPGGPAPSEEATRSAPMSDTEAILEEIYRHLREPCTLDDAREARLVVALHLNEIKKAKVRASAPPTAAPTEGRDG